MKLISMTDFVLEQDKLMRHQLNDPITFTIKVTDYALFLKQPLTLGMFVPCDDFDEPIFDKCKNNNYCVDFCQGKCNEDLIEAKSELIFANIKYLYYYNKNKPLYAFCYHKIQTHILEYNFCFFDDGKIKHIDKELFVIEDLIPYNLDLAVSF